MFNIKFQVHVINHFITKIKFLLSGMNTNRQLTSCKGRRLVPKNWIEYRKGWLTYHIRALFYFLFFFYNISNSKDSSVLTSKLFLLSVCCVIISCFVFFLFVTRSKRWLSYCLDYLMPFKINDHHLRLEWKFTN